MANTVHEGVKAYDNLAYGSMGPRIPVPALPPMASGDQPIDPDLWQRAEHENAILGLELHQVKLESVQKPGQKSHVSHHLGVLSHRIPSNFRAVLASLLSCLFISIFQNWPLYTPSGRLAPFTKNFFEHLPVDPPTGLVSIFTDKPPACSLVLAAQTQTQTRLQQLTGDLNKKLETSHGLYLRIAPLPTAQRPHQKWAGVQPQRAAPVDAAKHSVFSAALTFQGDQPQVGTLASCFCPHSPFHFPDPRRINCWSL